MKKNLFVLFTLTLAVLAGLPAMAEAQSRTGGWYGRGGYNNRYPNRQGRYGYDPRLDDPCFGADQYFEGIRGTFHFNRVNVKDSSGKKAQVVEKHFRACDPTNQPVRMRETAGWHGAGGAVIGYVLGGPKGAAIGGISGAAIGTIKGDDHKDCFPVDSNRPDLTFGTTIQPTFQKIEEASPVSRVEQGTQPTGLSVVGSLASVTWPTVNTTDFRAVVTDPNTGKERLIPAGASANLPEPAGEQPYVVVLLAPGRGNIDRVSGEIRPSHDFQGWDIVAR